MTGPQLPRPSDDLARIVGTALGKLKKECQYLYAFASLEEARRVIGEFIQRYNREMATRAARPSDPSRHPREPHAAGGVIKPPTRPGNRDLFTSTLSGGRRPTLMGSVGNAYGNALAESLFGTLEGELLDRRR